MKVILRKDYENLGNVRDVVEVKDGYARNYLIPQGIAVTATDKNMKVLQEEEKMAELRKNKAKRQAEELAQKLADVSLTAAVKVGEEDKVFGAVTAQDIAQLLQEKKFDIDKKDIELSEPIKALGVYTISIKLHTDVQAEVRLWVVKE